MIKRFLCILLVLVPTITFAFDATIDTAFVRTQLDVLRFEKTMAKEVIANVRSLSETTPEQYKKYRFYYDDYVHRYTILAGYLLFFPEEKKWINEFLSILDEEEAKAIAPLFEVE